MLVNEQGMSAALAKCNEFQIILADTEELREQVYRFRYNVYVKIMNRRQLHADHSNESICEPLDENGENFLAVKDGKVIGTIRRNLISDYAASYYSKLYKAHLFEDVDPRLISITTKLMMLPEYQKSTYPIRLVRAYAEDGYRKGVQIDLIDCNKPLIGFFEKMGYFSYIGWVFHKEFGTVRPMFLATDAIEYLKRINSFLYGAASPYVADAQHKGYRHIAKLGQEPYCQNVRLLSADFRATFARCEL